MTGAWWLSTVLAISATTAGEATGDFVLRDGDVVVFFGDGLTQERGGSGFHPKFPSFVESFVQARYPSLSVTFHNRARANQTAAAAAGRLEHAVLDLGPTVVLLCFGVTEARLDRSQAFSTESFTANLEKMVRELKKKNCRVWIMSPPAADVERFEALTNAETQSRLAEYAAVAAEIARRENVHFVDWHTKSASILAQRRREHPRFRLTNNGVDPLPIGHAVGAVEILRAWNAEPYDHAITIDFAERTATASAGSATVVDQSRTGSIDVRIQDLPLFWPLAAGRLVQAEENWPVGEFDRLLLRVKNGPETGMLMRQGEREVPVLPDQLAGGINLALTPGFRDVQPAVDLLKSIFSKNNVLAQAWLERENRRPAEPELQKAFETFLRSLEQYAQGYRAIAAGVPRTFEITVSLRDITAGLPALPAEPGKKGKPAAPRR